MTAAAAIAQVELVNDGIVSGSISVSGEEDEFVFMVARNESIHLRIVDTEQDIDFSMFSYLELPG